MPLPNLHMTAMEVTHSLTSPEIDALVHTITPASETIADLPSTPGSRARLIKPLLSFDAAALALSFVPAAAESPPNSNPNVPGQASDDTFTYHHLRRTLYDMISATGVPIASRYVVPSAHLTIARFNSPNPFDAANRLDGDAGRDMAKRKMLMSEVERINRWLEAEVWPGAADGSNVMEDGENKGQTGNAESTMELSGQWVVGEGRGLDFRKGALWYGGGETIYLGKGIEE